MALVKHGRLMSVSLAEKAKALFFVMERLFERFLRISWPTH